MDDESSDGSNRITMAKVYQLYHRYFFRYFLDAEVGHFWAILNGMISTFVLGFLALYAMKGWGLRSWNRNLIKNKKRFAGIALRRMKQEMSVDETEAKLEQRKRISAMGFQELTKKLQSGNVSAVQAVDAFRWKCLAIDEKFNCVTDFVREAPDMAKNLDVQFANKPKPPLFGVPFSVKENYHMAGYDVTLGLAKHIEEPVDDEATLVTYLKSLGAVPIVRTTVPQTMLSFAGSNPVHGVTKNPHNINCSPGGSSGGEAVIVATGGCLFGIGSDLAGSLRIPSHFCGIVTVKPTEKRLVNQKASKCADGCVQVALAYGFLTRDVETQATLLSLTFRDRYFDMHPEAVPLPFNTTVISEKRRLKIGFMVDDGWLEASPACARAVRLAVGILENEGHELQLFSVPDIFNALHLSFRALFPDNGVAWAKSLEYEDLEQSLALPYYMCKTPLFVRSLVSKMLRSKWPQLSLTLGGYNKDMHDLRQLYVDIKQYRRQFFEKWVSESWDALVCPVMPFAAVTNEMASRLNLGVSYTLLYNLLDMPAGVVPVTRTVAEDRAQLGAYPRCVLKGGRQESFTLWQNPVYHFIRAAVAEAGDNLPVAVQVVAAPYHEETCLRLMAAVEKGAKFEC